MTRRRGAPRRLASVAIATITLSVAACQVIAGIEDRSTGITLQGNDGAISGDAGPDGANGLLNNDVDATCVLASIPGPPDASRTSSDDISIVAAMNTVILPGTNKSREPSSYGLDLDGVCTCCDGGCSKANAGTCKPNGNATVCDFEGGIDNTGVALINSFQQFSAQGASFTELNINAGIVAGNSTILMQIRNYNGTSDDDSVELAFLVATSFVKPDGGPDMPQLDGTDVWDYSEESVLDLDADVPTDFPSFRSTAAYVRDQTLYADLSTLDITIGDVAMHLTGVQIRAGMAEDGDSGIWRFGNGIMAARWPASSILERFGNAQLNPDCTPSTTYALLKSQLCPYADLTADPTQGGNGVTDPSEDPPCDAMSLQIGFTAVTASFGSPQHAIVEPTPCPGFTYGCQ